MSFKEKDICPECGGLGWVDNPLGGVKDCPTCFGSGLAYNTSKLKEEDDDKRFVLGED